MKFDVFVSFREIDTRRTFVSHLLLSLFKNQITTFKHEEEILENKPPSPQVLQAIFESKIAIVVISKNYVASTWCLNELEMIFVCEETGLLEVVPVFYEVDPSDVLRQVDELEDHGDGDDNLEKVKMWTDALKKLIEIYHQKYSYWEDEDSYSYIIDQVLIHVSHCLSGELAPSDRTELKQEKTIIQADSSGAELLYRPEYCEVEMSANYGILTTSLCRPQCSEIVINLSQEETIIQAEDACGRELLCRPEYCEVEMSANYGRPMTSLCSLQCLSEIVIKGVELIAAALRKREYEEESSGVKPRPPGRFLDVQNNNYVIGNNLSQLVLSNDFNSFVGMDRLKEAVYTLLDLESRDSILEIGIFGERGVGKTTLARCVYDQISPQFQDHHYFINDTTSCYPGACLLNDIARASLTEESEILNEVVKAKLGHRKVLLIVDNIFDIQHLENIRNIAHRFGPGSRLIFVTNHKPLVLHRRVERLYVVEPLRYDEALQLFSQFAFKKVQVPRDYHRLSVRAIIITGRIPLALKAFGNFLFGKHISEWEHELCRLEAPQSIWDCVGIVSSYIGDALS